jgi:hypothetical protein
MNSRSTVAQKASLSEYTHSELPAQYAPEPNTLFDEDTFKEVEHIVDTRNVPYAEARTIVGVETPARNSCPSTTRDYVDIQLHK